MVGGGAAAAGEGGQRDVLSISLYHHHQQQRHPRSHYNNNPSAPSECTSIIPFFIITRAVIVIHFPCGLNAALPGSDGRPSFLRLPPALLILSSCISGLAGCLPAFENLFYCLLASSSSTSISVSCSRPVPCPVLSAALPCPALPCLPACLGHHPIRSVVSRSFSTFIFSSSLVSQAEPFEPLSQLN